MRILADGYVGIAPVPGGRVNIGIVLGPAWRTTLARDGAEGVARSIVAGIPPTRDDPAAWRLGRICDSIEGAWPLGQRVTRRAGIGGAGAGWLLVGDASGFLDRSPARGLHRALVSADFAASHLSSHARRHDARALRRAMRRRFRPRTPCRGSSRPSSPIGLVQYAARLVATRAGVRATMGLVMGDLVPPVVRSTRATSRRCSP
jgi:flavin-dependent dehydrogenase